MSELIIESDNEQIERGKLLKLKFGITKQKFVENKCIHILFNAPNLLFQSKNEELFLIAELSKTIKKFVCNAKSVLIVGLGNRHISADSFGTECLKRIIATRNLIDCKCNVSAISTSVFGLTGIESADIIKSVASVCNPEVIIVLDTLCANSYETLVTNFQISDAGFSPGAGVGNKRKSVNNKTLKIKTISIGVPFVVYAKSFIESAVDRITKNGNESDTFLINQMLKENFNNLVLTVKDIEQSIAKTAYIVSSAINMSLNDYTLDEQSIILGK